MCKNTCGVTKAEIDAQLLEYQNQAMRTLGFAYQELGDKDATIADSKVVADNLTFLGIVAISDPVRIDVPDAVSEVIDAGIKVKIVTGDTPGTAKEIGRQIGLWNDATDTDRNIITGPEFAELSDKQLKERVGELKIIARARPMDKKRLVEALQANNEVTVPMMLPHSKLPMSVFLWVTAHLLPKKHPTSPSSTIRSLQSVVP